MSVFLRPSFRTVFESEMIFSKYFFSYEMTFSYVLPLQFQNMKRLYRQVFPSYINNIPQKLCSKMYYDKHLMETRSNNNIEGGEGGNK